MAESDVGVSVAVTRQNAGRPVSVVGGVVGDDEDPGVVVLRRRMVVWVSCRPARLVHGVAAAGCTDRDQANRAMADWRADVDNAWSVLPETPWGATKGGEIS